MVKKGPPVQQWLHKGSKQPRKERANFEVNETREKLMSSNCIKTVFFNYALQSKWNLQIRGRLRGRCRLQESNNRSSVSKTIYYAQFQSYDMCSSASRLMGRLGKVDRHGGSTVSQIPLQDSVHLLCTQHYTSICMNPRYSGIRNWCHRNGTYM